MDGGRGHKGPALLGLMWVKATRAEPTVTITTNPGAPTSCSSTQWSYQPLSNTIQNTVCGDTVTTEVPLEPGSGLIQLKQLLHGLGTGKHTQIHS